MIICSSIGFGTPEVLATTAEQVRANDYTSAIILTDASAHTDNMQWAIVAGEDLAKIGVQARLANLSEITHGDLLAANIIYICGGNTFVLLHAIREFGIEVFRTTVTSADKLVIGVSAGSLIMTPTIRIASETEPDPNTIHMTDFTAFKIASFEIYPHYTVDLEQQIKAYEKKYDCEVKRISNEDLLVIP